MLIELSEKTVDTIKPNLPRDGAIMDAIHEEEEDGYRFRRSIIPETTAMSDEELELLLAHADKEQDRSLKNNVMAAQRARREPNNKIGKLRTFPDYFAEWMKKDGIDGWLYRDNGKGSYDPWLVTNVTHIPANPRAGQKEGVTINLCANGSNGESSRGYGGSGNNAVNTRSINIEGEDVRGKTIEDVMFAEGYTKETPDLKAQYIESYRRFRRFQPLYGKQFICNGQASLADDRWSSRTEGHKVDGTSHSFRCVNDEELVTRSVIDKKDCLFWKNQGADFSKVPYHCYIYLFHLDLHRQIWCHADHLELYVYNPSLKDKIVLPDSHRDLIDVLVTDVDVLMEDVIAGKSGGTTILCYGKPGLGKTLTAEVYCEVVERPLYKVNAGQLGTTPHDVEKQLEDILKRSERWGAVLLLDEADVYIRRRGNDIHQNAIVAAFLRTIEYFNGLFFMTSNLGDETDDAILSRCIARIKYDVPGDADLKSIWRILSTQFQIELSDELIDELVGWQKGLPGRDVKELLKLTSKYARRRGVPYDLDIFRKMGQFRGLS